MRVCVYARLCVFLIVYIYISKMSALFVLTILFLGFYPLQIINYIKIDYMDIHSSIINHIEQLEII